MVNSKHYRWTIESEPYAINGRKFVLCKCDCGNTKEVYLTNIKRGLSKSCGCLSQEMAADRKRTHGQDGTPTNAIWKSMKQRCSSKNKKEWKSYGGKNITVCDRWIDSFENFIADMGEKPVGMCIDRIDNSKGYSPDNCRWVTAKVNIRNRDITYQITYNGITQPVSAWAEQIGIKYTTLWARLNIYKMSVEQALTRGLYAKVG